MRKLVGLIFVLFLIAGCKKDEPIQVDYKKLLYKDVHPVDVVVDDSAKENAIVRQVSLRYPVILGDTLNVNILEFKSDVYALDYYMNSGRFLGITPILRGEFLEQSIRANSRIFIFRHDAFRKYDRSDLEAYVRRFPGYKGGFPQEFLSLPFEYREAGRTSIQTKYFLGIKSTFPVIVQSYRNAHLQWNIARSWESVESSAYDEWTRQLDVVNPQGISTHSDWIYFRAGEGSRGIATRLAGGRVAVIWGYLDWVDLDKNFQVASQRVYEAMY